MSTVAKVRRQSVSEKESEKELNLEFSAWMSKPIIQSINLLTEIVDGLEFVVPLDTCIICGHIPIVDSLYENNGKSKYMFTVYSGNKEKVYYVATAQNRKARKMCTFKYRFVDQYDRHILSVRKSFSLFGNRIAEIRCPPGKRVADILRRKIGKTSEYKIMKERETNFTFQQLNESTFDLIQKESKIGSISKMKHTVKQGPSTINNSYIQLNFPVKLLPKDKMCLISAALIINLFHFERKSSIF